MICFINHDAEKEDSYDVEEEHLIIITTITGTCKAC
jgi:hypothetical protein